MAVTRYWNIFCPLLFGKDIEYPLLWCQKKTKLIFASLGYSAHRGRCQGFLDNLLISSAAKGGTPDFTV